MPVSEELFLPRVDGRFVGGHVVTALPHAGVQRGQVEVRASKVSFQNIRRLEALSRVVASVTDARADLAPVGGGVAGGGDGAERQVPAQAVHVPVARVQLEEIVLSAAALGVPAPPIGTG